METEPQESAVTTRRSRRVFTSPQGESTPLNPNHTAPVTQITGRATHGAQSTLMTLNKSPSGSMCVAGAVKSGQDSSDTVPLSQLRLDTDTPGAMLPGNLDLDIISPSPEPADEGSLLGCPKGELDNFTLDKFVESMQHVSQGLSSGVHTYGSETPSVESSFSASPLTSPGSQTSDSTGTNTTPTGAIPTTLARTTSTGRLKVSSLSYALSQPRLGTEIWAPSWMRCQHIQTGYRLNYTPSMCLGSICGFHNETCNVWTHLIGMAIFIALGVYRFTRFSDSILETGIANASASSTVFSLQDAMWSHQLAFLIFYATVTICMLLSASYHLFGCVSRHINELLYKLDMTGICLMIFGSYLPGLTVGFSCRPDLALIYCLCIAAIIGGVIICHNVPACLDDKWFNVRIGLIVSTVLFAFLPCLHWYLISPWEQLVLIGPVLMGTIILYKVGFLFWVTKIPECWFPGKFDFIFNSHNIWHTFVVLAPLFWDFGLHSCLRLIYSGGWNCMNVSGASPELRFEATTLVTNS